MKLNQLVKTDKKKNQSWKRHRIWKRKTSGRGHKGQKSRRGVAIKSYEGGQMPLYRRLPKEDLNQLIKKMAILNLSNLQNFYDKKRIDFKKI